MKEKLLKIINHHGVRPQLKHFQSEVFELTEAILDYELTDIITNKEEQLYKGHIAEEIADCLNFLDQFIELYKLDKDQINIIMESKVDRQLERISKEVR